MKVMLINPNSDVRKYIGKYSRFVPPVLPVGIGYIASLLQNNGIEVSVIDQFATRMSNGDLLKKIASVSPQIVGFSCLTPALSNVENIVKGIREFKKDIVIVLGNIHATVFTDDVLRKRIADIVVRGEGEFSMLELALAIERDGNLQGIKGISFLQDEKIYHNAERPLIQNLDDLSYPDWQLFDLHYYNSCPMLAVYDITIPIQGSRGCPYRCMFCAQEAIHKKPRYRESENIVAEIEYMYEKFGVNHFGFVDAYFPFSIKHGLEFCDKFMQKGLHKKVKWFTETRVDLVNLELLKNMKKAGLHSIMYGVEVGNEKILQSIRKGATLEEARAAMRATKEAGVVSLGLFILGLPGETRQTCNDTIRFARELDCDFVKFNTAVPLPGSEFFENYKHRINNSSEVGRFTSWVDQSQGEVIYSPEGMSSQELINLQTKGMFEFYVRPKIIIRHIIKRTITFKNLYYGGYVLISNYFRQIFNQFRERMKLE